MINKLMKWLLVVMGLGNCVILLLEGSDYTSYYNTIVLLLLYIAFWGDEDGK